MTLHESKHPGYSDLGRLHQHFIGDTTPVQPAEGTQGMPATGAVPAMPPLSPMPPLPAMPPLAPPTTGAGLSPSPQSPVQAPTADTAQPRRPERALYKHADLGPFRSDLTGPGTGTAPEEDCFDRLARQAEPEPWSGPGTGRGDRTRVLREYIEWTFERLYRRRLVATSPDGAHSAFNTGLMTVQQEPIHGLFAPNRDPDGPPWQLQGWCTDGDRQLSDHFPEPPAPATYAETPADLVFDWRCLLVASTKHLLESKDTLAALPGPLRSNPYQAGLVLEGAVRRAEARARRDHRAAVPCWDPITERIELLLPLALTTPGTADVALAVTRAGDVYHGRTLLALDLAYARARQLGPVQEWLKAE